MRQTGSVQTRADLWVRLASRMEWKEPGKKERSKKCARENTGRKEKGLINCHSSAEKCAGAPNLLVSLPLFTSALEFSVVRPSPALFLFFNLNVVLTAGFDATAIREHTYTHVPDNKYGNDRNCSIDQRI